MYTILLFVILFASFLFYNSSERVKFSNRPKWLTDLSRKKSLIRSVSIGIWCVAMAIVLWDQGLGSGFFALFAYIMAMLSVVVLLNPYKYLRWQHLIVVLVLGLVLEFVVF
ncbi:hypothetical protein [Sphingobacterium sp. SGG-5]|uniref:hypothetical protein n=1 Tax=Sphingobacterium sp. SGG-5 TaxID=2710881 RepID=UPI0019D16C83|nr:hypothetical protein [Sphingobacterium sp. SGG-5]